MAAQTLNLSGAAYALKEYYYPRLLDQYFAGRPMYEIHRTNEEDVVGESLQATIAYEFTRPEGFLWGGEAVGYPNARNTSGVQGAIPLYVLIGAVQMSEHLIRASSRPGVGSFDRMMTRQMDALKESAVIELDRSYFSQGSDGAIAQLNGAGVGVTAGIVDDAFMLEDGMVVDVYTARTGGSQEVNSIAISSVDKVANTFSFASNQTWSDNSFIFREDSRGNYPIASLLSLVDGIDSQGAYLVQTIHGVDRATYPEANAYVDDNNAVNRALTTALIQKTFEFPEKRLGQGRSKLSHIISSFDVRREYFDLLSAERNFYVDKTPMKLDGGFNGVSYTGGGYEVPWLVHRFCPSNRVFFIDASSIQKFQNGFMVWKPGTRDDIWEPHTTEALSWVSYLYSICGLGATRFNCNAVLRDIAVSS